MADPHLPTPRLLHIPAERTTAKPLGALPILFLLLRVPMIGTYIRCWVRATSMTELFAKFPDRANRGAGSILSAG